MKIKSVDKSNSLILELYKNEVGVFKKDINKLISGLNNELILNCEVEVNIFKNINKDKVKFILNYDLEENLVSTICKILTFNLDYDTYDHMLGLIDDIISKKIPQNMIEISEISSKKWKQTYYLVLSII